MPDLQDITAPKNPSPRWRRLLWTWLLSSAAFGYWIIDTMITERWQPREGVSPIELIGRATMVSLLVGLIIALIVWFFISVQPGRRKSHQEAEAIIQFQSPAKNDQQERPKTAIAKTPREASTADRAGEARQEAPAETTTVVERPLELKVQTIGATVRLTGVIATNSGTATGDKGLQPNEYIVREEIMNDKQKHIIKVAIAVVVAMLAFPPFYIRLQQGIVVSLGYGFLLDPPHYGSRTDWLGTVDVGLLLVQWIAVILIAGVLWWLAKDKV